MTGPDGIVCRECGGSGCAACSGSGYSWSLATGTLSGGNMGVCEFCHAETEIERHKESCPWQGTATEIIGVKFVEQASAFVRYNGLTYVIKGYPACPMCKEILTKVPTNRNVEEVSIWHCEGCGTTWESHDLVEAIVTEDMLLDEGKR